MNLENILIKLNILVDSLVDFYENNETLAIALISSLFTLIITKFIPAIFAYLKEKIYSLLEKAGGKFSLLSIQKRYLNWVVLSNEELNLTGVIGLTNKPRLEQVFVSLKISKELESIESESVENLGDIEAEGDAKKNIASKISKNFQAIEKNFIKVVRNLYYKISSTDEEHELQIYSIKKFWRLRVLQSRDHFDFLVMIILFIAIIIIFPSIALLLNWYSNFFLSLLSTFFLATAIFVFVGFLVGEIKKKTFKLDIDTISSIILGNVIPGYLLYLSILAVKNYNDIPWGMIIGLSSGALVAFEFYSDEFDKTNSSKHSDEEKLARSRLFIGKLISSNDNIAILGNPGSGKSTFLQYVALTFAKNRAGTKNFRERGIARKRFGFTSWYFPLFIPLRKISSCVSGLKSDYSGNLIFEAFRQEILPSELRNGLSDKFLISLLSKRKCIFLFDGLDEVANDEEFHTIVNEINGLVSTYPGNKYIITSRHSGWRGGVGPAFIETKINEMGDAQMRQFISDWYKAIAEKELFGDVQRKHKMSKAIQKAENLVLVLNKQKNIKHLARNPLLLSMICFVHFNKTLPDERLSLYEDCSRLLLEQWDREKGIYQDDIPLNLSRKELILATIAYGLHSGQLGDDDQTKEVKGKEIIRVIADMLDKFGLDRNLAETIFKKLVLRTGIIVSTERYKDLYSFSHLTFQEFFTAKYINSINADIFEIFERLNVYEQSRLAWWQEVILLYSNMHLDVGQIIHKLCSLDGQNLANIKFKIAVQCYLESIEKPKSEIRSLLLTELVNIRSLGKYCSVEKMPKEVEKYLLEFALDSCFVKNSFMMHVETIDSLSEAKKLKDNLMAITSSSNNLDREMAYLAILAIFEKWPHDFKLYSHDYKAIIKLESLELFEAACNYITSIGNASDGEDAQNFLYEIGLLLIASIYKYYEYSEWEQVCQILDLIFLNIPYNYNLHIRLVQEFKLVRTHLNKHHGIDINLMSKIYYWILHLDNKKQVIDHKDQLHKMIEKGRYIDKRLAIQLLEKFHTEDINFPELFKKHINAPSSSLRRSLISLVRKGNYVNEIRDDVKKLCENSIKSTTDLSKFLFYLKSVVLGIGNLGLEPPERIQVHGTTFILNSNVLEFENVIREGIIEFKNVPWKSGEYLEAWLDVFIDLYGLVPQSTILCFFELIEIFDNLSSSRTFFEVIAKSPIENFNDGTKKSLIKLLISSKYIYSIGTLRILGMEIIKDSEEFQLLMNEMENGNIVEKHDIFDMLYADELVCDESTTNL